MLQNDKRLKQKPSSTARAVYQHELDGDSGSDGDDEDYVDKGFAPDRMTLYLMPSTISTPPISTGILRSM